MILDKPRKLVDSPSEDIDCDPQRNPKGKLSNVYITLRRCIVLLAFIIRLSIAALLALHSAKPADAGMTPSHLTLLSRHGLHAVVTCFRADFLYVFRRDIFLPYLFSR